MSDAGGDYYSRNRSRSPRRRSSRRRSRSRTPRRSYSPRSRSRSREGRRRRSRTPLQHRDSHGKSDGGSNQDRRVYVGNLSYDVKWHHLKDFMRSAGEVAFADVLTLPNGMSKGCGIVEYSSRDEAQNAITSLSNQTLMGRMVYVREDREQEPKFSGSSRGGYSSRNDYHSRGGYGGYGGSSGGSYGNHGNYNSYGGGYNGGGGGGSSSQLFVQNLPYNAGWQDLKDLFRSAGNVIRADVHMAPDGRPKGSGIVLFETAGDAQNAISTLNGYEWNGRNIEIREDRFAAVNASRGFRGDRGGFNGGFRGGFSSRGRGSYGGFGGYDGNYQSRGNYYEQNNSHAAPNPFTDGAVGNGERSATIHVRNLPWSTSNDDLVELFSTIGKVERAEIQYEGNGRSKGSGVVQFDTADSAQLSISKFTGYMYGNRPLGLSFVRYENEQGHDHSQGEQAHGHGDQGHVDYESEAARGSDMPNPAKNEMDQSPDVRMQTAE